jgi:hypothetical protein
MCVCVLHYNIHQTSRYYLIVAGVYEVFMRGSSCSAHQIHDSYFCFFTNSKGHIQAVMVFLLAIKLSGTAGKDLYCPCAFEG